MSVTISKTNKPLNPRAKDLSPKGYNRASLYSGKALDFDGVNDQVNVTTSDVDFGANDFTVTAIANWTGSNADGKLAYAERGTSPSALAAWQIRTDGAGNMKFQTNTASGGWTEVSFSGVEAILNKGLTHLTFVRVGSSVTLYINGALYSSGSGIASTLDPANGNFCIGNRIGSANYWNGLIGQYKIFNTALTAGQVSDLYNNPEKIVPDGVANSALKLWLPMMEGAGTTVYDGSGNGNHGSISGATWTSGIGAPVAQTALVGWNKGTNLLPSSEDYSFAGYTRRNISVTEAYAISPDGTQNASLLTPSGTDSAVLENIAVTSGTTYAMSVWLKSATGSNLSITIALGSAGFPESEGDGGKYKNITVTTEWQRFSIVSTADASVGTDVSIGGFSGLATGENILAWGWQFEQASSVGPYIPTFATAQTSPVLLPQGLTANKDITNVNSVSRNAYALNLDGASWAEVHDNASLDFGTGDFTLECWVVANFVNTGSGYNGILNTGGEAAPIANAGAYIGSTSSTLSAGCGTASFSFGSYVAGDWYHLIFTRESGTVKTYTNGAFVNSYSNTTNVTKPQDAMVGNDNLLLYRTYKDQIALPRIYNRALTATEVARNYNADKSKFGL